MKALNIIILLIASMALSAISSCYTRTVVVEHPRPRPNIVVVERPHHWHHNHR